MEGSGSRKTTTTSSSISELFDGLASQSSAGLFGYGGDSSRPTVFRTPEVIGREPKNEQGNEAQSGPREGHSFGKSLHNGNGNNSQKGKNFHGKSQNVSDTFLGSSLYYGGRDLYCDPSTTKTEGLHGMKKDNTEDDSNNSNSSASRGNWWQGSLYY